MRCYSSKFCVLLALLSLKNVYGKAGEEELLSQYWKLHPFHQSIIESVEVQKCQKLNRNSKKEVCHTEIQQKDNPKKFHELLSNTKKFVGNTNNSNFLNSPLGRQYQSLKKFINIYEQFQSCEESASWGTRASLDNTFSRLISNIGPCPPLMTTNNTIPRETVAPIFHVLQSIQGEGKHLPPESSFLEDQILGEALKRSLKARILFAHKFKNQKPDRETVSNFCQGPVTYKVSTVRGLRTKKRQGNICTDEEKALLETLVDEIGQKLSSSNSPVQVATDLNQRIALLNFILESYNKEKQRLEQQWREEDDRKKTPSRVRERLKRGRSRQLFRLKKAIFENYQTTLYLLHAQGAGDLLQTDAIREKSGLPKLEIVDPKFWGIGGFELSVLKSKDDFPLLDSLKEKDADRAIEESLSRTKQQVQELLQGHREKQEADRKYLQDLKDNSPKAQPLLRERYQKERLKSIGKLLKNNPGVVGSILGAHPEHAGILCQVAQNISRDERNHLVIKTGAYLVAGAAITVLGFTTLGAGLLPTSVLIAALGAGTAADYTYQISERQKHHEFREDVLNAYLSMGGDKRSIEDIKNEWISTLKADKSSKTALALGTLEIFSFYIAKAIRVAKTAKDAKTFFSQKPNGALVMEGVDPNSLKVWNPKVSSVAVKGMVDRQSINSRKIMMGMARIDQDLPLHQHKATEIYYVLKGKGRTTLKVGNKDIVTEIEEGSFLYLPSGMPHYTIADPNNPLELLYIFAKDELDSVKYIFDNSLKASQTRHVVGKLSVPETKKFSLGSVEEVLVKATDPQDTGLAMKHLRLSPKRQVEKLVDTDNTILFVREGRGFIISNGKRTPLKKGDHIYLPKDTRYSIQSADNEGLDILTFLPLQ